MRLRRGPGEQPTWKPPANGLDPLWMALGTLTALPVPAPRTIDAQVAGRAMLLAPLAAVPLALGALAVVLVGELFGLFPLLVAVGALGVVALGTRALHWDGLADTADGLGASYDQPRALEVMRKGDVGPMGVAALVFVLLGQVAALGGAIAHGHGVYAVALAVITGRVAVTLTCTHGVPSARPKGLGATVAGSVGQWQAAAVAAGAVVLAAASGLVAGPSWWIGVLAVFLGIAAAGALLARCVQRLGGITGDVIGGCVEVAVLGALIPFAA